MDGGIMRNNSEIMPIRATSAGASKLGAQLFRAAYLCAVAVAMVGWSIALGWGSLSLLRLFL